MNPKCIYEIKTKIWGTVRVDEATYQDFIAGRSWLCHGMNMQKTTPVQVLPVNVCPEAKMLMQKAKKTNPYILLLDNFPGIQAPMPYKPKMSNIPVNEMVLSVRSTNALRRSSIDSFEQLNDKINSSSGIRSIRCLGEKSEKEILEQFFNSCYLKLNEHEKASFWQDTLDKNGA